MITANPIGLILTGTCRGSINTLSYGIAKLRRLVENETSLLSAEHFIELSKLINSLKTVERKLVDLFVFQNLDSKEDTSLFKAVIDDYMQELDIEGKSIEELEFSDPSLLLDEVSGYSTQALLKTLVAKFPKLDFFSDN